MTRSIAERPIVRSLVSALIRNGFYSLRGPHVGLHGLYGISDELHLLL